MPEPVFRPVKPGRVSRVKYVPAPGETPEVKSPRVSARRRRQMAVIGGGGFVALVVAGPMAALSADIASAKPNDTIMPVTTGNLERIYNNTNEVLNSEIAQLLILKSTIVGALAIAGSAAAVGMRKHQRSRSDHEMWLHRNDVPATIDVHDNGDITVALKNSASPAAKNIVIYVELDRQSGERELWAVPIGQRGMQTFRPAALENAHGLLRMHWERRKMSSRFIDFITAREPLPSAADSLGAIGDDPAMIAIKWSDGAAPYLGIHPEGYLKLHALFVGDRDVTPALQMTRTIGNLEI